jgi:sulfur carrier protein ThiS
MNIEVRLYGDLKYCIPSGSAAFDTFDLCCAGDGMMKSLEKEMTIEELVKELDLPEDIPKVVIVNDKIVSLDYVLKDGDRVSVFPPIAGG